MPAQENNDGPPQEGLDPKLGMLTDLAPGTTATGEQGVEGTATAAAAADFAPPEVSAPELVSVSAKATTTEAPNVNVEQPPQVGQDPKLLACVHDGEDNMTPASVNGSNGPVVVHVHNPSVNGSNDPVMVHVPGEKEEEPKVKDEGDGQDVPKAEAPPSPTKTAVAATTISIQDNAAQPSSSESAAVPATVHEPSTNEQQQPEMSSDTPTKTSPTKQKVEGNTNPNLTSSAKLAEWNRIHASTAPNYDFFKKSQEQKKKMGQLPTLAHEPGRNVPPIEELVEQSKVRTQASSAAVAAAVGTSKRPIFTLNSMGEATVLGHPEPIHKPMDPALRKAAEEEARKEAATSDLIPSLPPQVTSSIEGAEGALPAIPLIPLNTSAPAKVNSNFWLQEEEERFLLGLRLYGWGQWKRIQTVVQTRSNKQIKSHAQKREKVNPDIKAKYGKGKSRRGRISSKVLADDARSMAAAGGSVGEIVGNEGPTLDQAWKDVYGTNNGDGPNSRARRYRQQQQQSRLAEAVIAHSPSEGQKLAMLETSKQQQQQQQEASAIAAATAAAVAATEQAPPLPNPVYNAHQQTHAPSQYHHPHYHLDAVHATHHYHHPHYAHHAYGAPMAYQPPPLPADHNRAPAASHHAHYQHHQPHHQQQQQPAYSSTEVHLPEHHQPRPAAAPPAPVTNHAEAPPITANPAIATAPTETSPTKVNGNGSLRPGMLIYSRAANKTTWSAGTIYSAKVDPSKVSESTVPLIYHIQYDNGTEDPNVPEDAILSKAFYDDAINDLERYHSLPVPANYVSQYPHPLDGGTPVYCQWMDNSKDSSHPEIHGRWLAGTIHSCQQERNGESSYHILFDDERERKDVPQQYVMNRIEYHELMKQKQEPNLVRPIGELYKIFSLKGKGADNEVKNGNPAAEVAGTDAMDLLSMASRIATGQGNEQEQQTQERAKKRAAEETNDAVEYKRQKIDEIERVEV